jgi:hypothetical protein
MYNKFYINMIDVNEATSSRTKNSLKKGGGGLWLWIIRNSGLIFFFFFFFFQFKPLNIQQENSNHSGGSVEHLEEVRIIGLIDWLVFKL